MTITQSPNNGILALGPPSAPEATSPVSGAHYGVPIHVYDLKPMGLKIDIFPPIVGKLAPGDIIRLIVNGASTSAIKTIAPGEENTVNTLYLPKGLLLQNRINTLIYTITRNSENAGTSTPELTLLYNSIRPGNQDLTPGDGAHSELQLILPQDVLDHGIDAERARQGVMVIFSYPFCRAHDHIWLNCNGSDVHYCVSIDEAPAIPSAEPTNISIMVGEDEFQKAGDSPTFVFSYTVTDQLGNGPDANSPFSGVVTVDVHLKQTRMAAPDLAEDPTDPNDDPDTIDLGKLGKKDLSVLVPVFAPQWQINDKIHMIYTAAITGGPVMTHTAEENVSRVPFTYPLLVPNDKVIADSVVRVKYELVRDGSVIAISKIATAVVIGAGSIELLPPFLGAPAVSPIDVLAYPDGVMMSIEYLGALDGDRARLVQVNAPTGAPQFPLVGFNSNKRVNTLLSPAFLAAWHGWVIEFRWNLNRGGEQAGRSPMVKVSVMKIADEDPRLPTPNIDGETSGQLEIRTLEAGSRIRAVKWATQKAGEPVWITLKGVDRAGNPITKEVWSGELNESANGLSVAAPIEWLRALRNDTPMTIECAVSLDDSHDKPKAVLFPVRVYTIKQEFASGEDFNETPSTPFIRYLKIQSMLITCPFATHGFSISTVPAHGMPAFPGEIDGSALFLGGSAMKAEDTRIDLEKSCTEISFWYSRALFTGGYCSFFDNANKLLGRIDLFVTGYNSTRKGSFTAANIKVLVITCPINNGIAFDNFSWH